MTARWARELGRRVAAVPGEVVSPLSAGPHALLRDGADLIGGGQDVLDRLFGVGRPPRARQGAAAAAAADGGAV